MILTFALYGCETWSLTLMDKRRLRVFENRVLRRMFGLSRNEVTGEWRNLNNEDLNDQLDKNEMGGAYSTYWERRGYIGFWWTNTSCRTMTR